MDLRSFFRASGSIHVASMLSLIGSVGFYALTLHLDTASFGAFHAFFSLSVLLGAGQVAVASAVVLHAKDRRSLNAAVQNLLVAGAILAAFLCGGVIFAAPLIRDFLHTRTLLPFYLLALSAFPTILTGLLQGAFNVQRRFGLLSLLITAASVLRLPFTVLLLWNGYDELDTAWVILGSATLTFLCCLPSGLSILRSAWGKQANDAWTALKSVVLLFASSLFFSLALKFDVLWARHALPAEGAGSYALLASVALVVFFVSSGIGRVTSVALRDGNALRAVLWSYMQIILAALAGILGFIIAGEWTLSIVAGRSIDIDWPVLLPLFASSVGYALIIFSFTCLNVLTKRVHVGIGCALIIAQGIGFLLIDETPVAIAGVQCTVMVVAAIIVVSMLLRTIHKGGKTSVPNVAEPHFVGHG